MAGINFIYKQVNKGQTGSYGQWPQIELLISNMFLLDFYYK